MTPHGEERTSLRLRGGIFESGKTDKTDAMRKFVVSEERARHGVNLIHTLSAVEFEFKSDMGEKGR